MYNACRPVIRFDDTMKENRDGPIDGPGDGPDDGPSVSLVDGRHVIQNTNICYAGLHVCRLRADMDAGSGLVGPHAG